MMKTIKNEEGSALVLAMMVLLVFVALGTAVGTVTVGSYRLSDNNREYNSAYYIAEAGANMAYEEIESYVLEAYDESLISENFFDKMGNPFGAENNKKHQVYDNFEPQSGTIPEAIVSVEGPEGTGKTRKYTIKSTGEVAGKTRTVEKPITINWVRKGDNGGTSPIPDVPTGAVLIAKNKLNILNGTITGETYISSTKNNSIKLSGGQGGSGYTIFYPVGASYESILDDSQIYTPTPSIIQKDFKINWPAYDKLLDLNNEFDMPIQTKRLNPYEHKHSEGNKYWLIDQNGNVNLNNWMVDEYVINLEADLYIPTIDIDSGKKLIFNTGEGDYKIYVDKLKVMSGSLDIRGSGSLTLIVRDTTSFRQTSDINQSGSSNQLFLVYTGNSPNFSEITSINGHIISIGHNSNITIKNSSINGVFLADAKKIHFIGGNIPSNMMMIAPKGEIILDEGYQINGTLIGNVVTTVGGGTIEFKEVDTSEFTYGSGNIEVELPTKGELINSDSATEQ